MLSFITLRNFKCFKELRMRLAPLTLVSGVNGAGKSTAIQALLMLRQTVVDNNYDAQAEVVINGSLVETGTFSDLLYSEAKSSEITIEIERDQQSVLSFNSLGETSRQGFSLKSTCSNNLDEEKAHSSLFADDFVYLYADRMHPCMDYSRDGKKPLAGRLGDRYGSNTAFRLMDSLNRNEKLPIPQLKHPFADTEYVIENVSRWVSHIMGHDVIVNAQELNGPDRVKVEYVVNTPNGITQTMSPVNMPFGHSYILPIVLSVMTAPMGSLIIIENPESHLHPSAQTRMGLFLSLAAHNGVQVIIETHSDHLMNGIRLASITDGNIEPHEAEICYFSLESDGFTHHSSRVVINPDGSMDSWPSGFFDEWELSLNRLFEKQLENSCYQHHDTDN